jgi:hypothetical protein
MFRLPVSRTDIEFRHATGAEDMLLLESDRALVETSIALAQELTRQPDGSDVDAEALPVSDLEAVLLELRRRVFGDLIVSRVQCPAKDCGAATDVSFRISEYVAHHRARKPANVEPAKEAGWWQLVGEGVEFRLATAGDLAAAVRSPNPERELALRTIRSNLPRAWKRAQKAMLALAPPLSGDMEGKCPQCGASVRFWFDVQSYVQRELRYDAEFLYEDVHLLASRYHWTEEKILSLPRERRVQYVEMALRGAGGR